MEAPALTVALPTSRSERAPAVLRLVALNAAAWRLAERILGAAEGAEDVVQQSYLAAFRQVRAGLVPAEERTWFLRVVANQAKKHLRNEANRRRREAAVMRHDADLPRADEELVPELRRAMEALEDRYRVPIALCYEEGLSQREAAAVLEMPESTVSKYVNIGLERLRESLKKAGYAAVPAAVVGGLSHTAPAVPATLAAAIDKLISGAMMTKGTGAAAVSAAAKGGMAMKVIVGVVLAGALAGAVAVVNGVGAGFKPAPTALSSPPAAAPAEAKPGQVNPYTERQTREEVFEFTEKPKVTKDGGKWVVTFASKGKCDATVTVLGPDGKIVRHLACGVLGKNAPWPFQQNALAQKIEWDGQTDMRKSAPAGCKVRVALGLKAAFERNIGYDPNDLCGGSKDVFKQDYSNVVSAEADGKLYAGVINGYGINSVCRVYEKDGKYVKTVWPPPAAEWEKVAAAIGVKSATTIWGDKVPAVTGKFGPWAVAGDRNLKEIDKIGQPFAAMLSKLTGVAGFKVGRKPAAIPAGKYDAVAPWGNKFLHLTVDSDRDYLYAGAAAISRFNGKTGDLDTGWFGGRLGDKFSEMAVGPDGLLYLRYGGSCNGYHMFRLDQETNKIVPFKSEYVVKDWSHLPNKNLQGWNSVPKQLSPDYSLPPLGAVWCGNSGNSGCFQTGLNISPDGRLVTGLREVDPGWAKLQGHPEMAKQGMAGGSFLSVYDLDGKLLGVNVIGDTGNGGHGVAIDREGSVYAGFGAWFPAGQDKYDGVADEKYVHSSVGSIIKFRDQGSKYPLNTGPGAQAFFGLNGKPKEMPGALWVYGGLIGLTGGDCCCHHVRFEMDRHARMWIPAGHVAGIMVIDSNSNRIARFGRYGNVDDTEADLKEKKDGLRFAWPRAVIASESAMYVLDPTNRRILKAALSYAAEETVPAP